MTKKFLILTILFSIGYWLTAYLTISFAKWDLSITNFTAARIGFIFSTIVGAATAVGCLDAMQDVS